MSVYTEHRNVGDLDDEDIYRGEPPSHVEKAPSVSSISSTTTDSSSSSSSFMGGGRLGAIAAKLELAIARWGRNVRGTSSVSSGASSSSSSSSSSSCSSIVTLTKSQIARRRRKRSRGTVESLRTMRSERDIAARITRMKALEKSREIPREFALFLPASNPAFALRPSIHPSSEAGPSDKAERRITWTASLPLVLEQLGLATRRPGRVHRGRARGKRAQSLGPGGLDDYFDEGREHAGTSADEEGLTAAAVVRRGKKGKQRAGARVKPSTIVEESTKSEAWFLDVANPTWADLRAIGKVLHIHPLTLEDILQQDPREKLEIFSKLGYYFVSFRAIESQATREKIHREVIGLKDAHDENSIGEANVYLTVFKGGICCFHFTDVSEHTDRVRNRMVLLEQVVNMSSDWIAHDILDSIVDSFFPVLHEIEKEVMAIDHMVFNPRDPQPTASPAPSLNSDDTIKPDSSFEKSTAITEKPHKYYTPAEKFREDHRPRFVSPRLSVRLLARRLRRKIGLAWGSFWAKPPSSPNERQDALRRMARTRKQVTVLGRLLASKADVVTQIRKRLAKAGTEAPGSDELEVAIYMGDVEDHILTLQNALAHYERMLSQSHPTYLAQLRTETDNAKGSMDMNILYLSTVSIGALCIGPLIGSMSMNCTIPTNNPGHKLNAFAIVVSLATLILVLFLALVRYWWRQAKKRITRY